MKYLIIALSIFLFSCMEKRQNNDEWHNDNASEYNDDTVENPPVIPANPSFNPAMDTGNQSKEYSRDRSTDTNRKAKNNAPDSTRNRPKTGGVR